jgi:hypothetical protein
MRAGRKRLSASSSLRLGEKLVENRHGMPLRRAAHTGRNLRSKWLVCKGGVAAPREVLAQSGAEASATLLPQLGMVKATLTVS